MSVATAFGDDGSLPGLPASHIRAFLHALARRLNRAALRTVSLARKAVRSLGEAAVAVARTASTTVQIAFARGGLQGSVSLLLAAGQLTRYAVSKAVVLARKASHWAAARIEQLARYLEGKPVREMALGALWLTVPLFVAVAVVAVVERRRTRTAKPRTTVWVVTDAERDQLASRMFVVLATDGSVRVHGIPATIEQRLRIQVAEVAARAAEQRLESLVGRGRPLTSLDLQAVNVAARAAVTQRLEAEAA